MAVGLEEVPHVSDVVVSYTHKFSAWVRRIVEIVRSIKHEVFTDFVDSMYGYLGQEIIGKRDIISKGVPERLLCPQEFGIVFTPWRRTLWYDRRKKT